jgi:prevent-host-death family protein
MRKTNIADLRNQLSSFLKYVENGNEVEINKHNITIAKIIPINQKRKNITKLGIGRKSAIVKCDLTKPLIPIKNWEMLRNKK